jgi:hypothetical protein
MDRQVENPPPAAQPVSEQDLLLRIAYLEQQIASSNAQNLLLEEELQRTRKVFSYISPI